MPYLNVSIFSILPHNNAIVYYSYINIEPEVFIHPYHTIVNMIVS